MVCSVPNCPASRVGQSPFCQQHELARTAKELRLGPNSDGLCAVLCGKCRRAFKDDDFVERHPYTVKTRRGETSKWIHVHCDPKVPRPSRKTIRESAKPLLSET
jgi:hypothetical protein